MLELRITFEEDGDYAEWIENVTENLPKGATATLDHPPVLVNMEDVADEHIGQLVKVGTVSGTLEAVFPHQYGLHKTFVIDGKAYDIAPFEIAMLTKKEEN